MDNLRPYRFSFTSDTTRHVWVRFYRDMETAFADSKKVALRENADAHGFLIESDQGSEDIRKSWGLDYDRALAAKEAVDKALEPNELKPYSYDDHTPEEWKEFLAKLHAGERIAIDESMFDYFLGVLPPIFMGEYVTDRPGDEGRPVRISFGFAEGAEPITYFWRTKGNEPQDTRYFCQRSKRMNPYA